MNTTAPVSRTFGLLLSCLLLFLGIVGVDLAAVPPNFVNEVLVTNLNEAVAIEFLPDDRMLVVGRLGTIWLSLPASGYTRLEPTPFLQIPNISNNSSEDGVFTVTLDPAFAQNGHFYVFYTALSPQVRDRVSRFTAVGNTTDPSTELMIWEDVASPGFSHHGGSLAFGPDGYLYISVGEHLNSANSQDLKNPRGKILRIARNGTIPTSNPFYDGAGPNYDEIWAYGLRNPFRMSFDSLTGAFYIADVGGNNWSTAQEEVNRGLAGANYGWPLCEGTCSTPGLTSPIYSYPHFSRDASITGGFVYRANRFPSSYQGVYFFGDYAQNWIKYLTFDANGNVTGAVAFEPQNGVPDGPYGNITDLKQGPDGSLYYVDYNYDPQGLATPGQIRRIRYTAGNQPPVVAASANPRSGSVPLTVAFSSAGTFDPEGAPLTYSWDFGDQTSSTSPNPTHVYSASGAYTARLSVSDGANTAISSPISIVVGQSPQPTINLPANGLRFRAGNMIAFSGGATDPEDGTLPASSLSWTIVFHHGGHTHPGFGPINGVSSGTFQIPSTGHVHGSNTSYEIVLFATDSDGLIGRASIFIFPETVDLTIATDPPGLSVNLDGIPMATPFTLNSLIGFQHLLDAPNQSSGGTNYVFDSWSDGGAQQHTLVVPDVNRSYIARFVSSSASSLVGYWAFDEAGGTTASDLSGNNHAGTLVNGAGWTAGRFGGAVLLDGVDDFVDFGSFVPVSGSQARTISLWLKPSSADVAGDVVGWGTGSHSFVWRNANPHVPRVIANGMACNSESAGGGLVPNTWTHVVWSGGDNLDTYRMYKDGVLVFSCTANAPVDTSGAGLEIGDNGMGDGGDYQTAIDDVRIFSRELSPQEIADIHNATAPVLSNIGATNVTQTSATVSWNTNIPSDSQVEYGSTTSYGQLTPLDNALVTNHSVTLSGLAAGTTYHFRVRSKNAVGNLAVSSDFTFITASTGSSPSLIGHWTFDEGSGTTALDSSGNGHHGALVNGPVWISYGRVGGALSFDGVNDYVDFGAFLPVAGGGSRTVTAWIKPDPSDFAGFVLGWGIEPNEFYVRLANPRMPRIVTGAGNCDPGGSLSPGVWSHVAVTGSNDLHTYQIYINGVLAVSCMGNGPVTASGAGLTINAAADALHAEFDDVRIYGRILSAAEVMAVFNGNPPQ
jgi:glucose/arabinose dehydrogenase